MATSPNDDSISRHSAPPVSVNLGTYSYYMEMRAPLLYILSLHTTIRSVMHQPLSDFGAHLRKCVHKTNMSSKVQLSRPMHLIPSVRRQNGLRLLGHLLRFCQPARMRSGLWNPVEFSENAQSHLNCALRHSLSRSTRADSFRRSSPPDALAASMSPYSPARSRPTPVRC